MRVRKLNKLGMVTPAAALLLLPVLLLVSGCYTQEDTITIKKSGQVTFDSIVTVEDPDKQFNYETLKVQSFRALDDLKDGHWTVQQKGLSWERPYKFEFKGQGKLSEVAEHTKFYTLQKVNDKQYEITFAVPKIHDKQVKRSIIFAKASDENATIYDPDGKPVIKVDSVSPETVYTIKLK